MGMEWLILVGIFLITAFATYGIFVNAADARREHELEATMKPITSGALAESLDRNLETRGDVAENTVLETLMAQELANAEAALRRGLEREAQVHRSIAANVRSHLELLQRKASNS